MKPCKRGHIAPRRNDNGDCIECVHHRQREWYAANREADLARKAKWCADNIEQKRATDAAYYQKHRDKIIERSATYYAENREAGMAARRRYRQENLERLRAYDAERHARNPERAKSARRNRKARKRAAFGRHTAADIHSIAKAQRNRCAYCRADLRRVKRHVDHIVPLVAGGSNSRANLQVLCAPCNLAKHATDPIVFAQRLGMLL